jgi:hypothetical protein
MNYALFQKITKLQVTKIWKWEGMNLFQSHSISQPLKEIWQTLHVSHKYEVYFGKIVMLVSYLEIAMFMFTLS